MLMRFCVSTLVVNRVSYVVSTFNHDLNVCNGVMLSQYRQIWSARFRSTTVTFCTMMANGTKPAGLCSATAKSRSDAMDL